MNQKSIYCLLALLFGAITSNLYAQGTAFTYQGQLGTNGTPVNGPFDFRFALFNTNGNQVDAPETNLAVAVQSGIFTTTLDFGAVFTGSNYWLSIGVRTNGGNLTNAFTLLLPLQPLLPTPYAMFSTTASNLSGTLPATQLSGALPSAQIAGTYSGSVNFTNSTNSFAGTYFGNGLNLTNLNGSLIATGTVADARLSTNVALLNGIQVFTGTNSFTNRANAFTGTFFGNGVVSWIPVGGTSTQAVANAGYLLLNTNLTTVTLPPTNTLLLGDVVRISSPGSGGWILAGSPGMMVRGNFSSYSNSLWIVAAIPGAGNWGGMAAAASGSPMFAGGSPGLCISYDNGATWNTENLTGTSFYSVDCSSSGQVVYAAPNSGTGSGVVERSADGGNTWAGVLGSADFTAIACSGDGTKILTVATNGTSAAIYVSANSGGSWSTVSGLPTKARWSAVASSSDGSRQAAAIYGGAIYYSVNSAWGVSGSTGNWTALAASADGVRMAACSGGAGAGKIYTSSNGGASWAATGATANDWTCLTMSADGNRILAGAKNSVLYGSANFGTTWTPLSTTNALWSCVASSSDGSKVAGGINASGGQIYYSGIIPQFTASTVPTAAIGGGQGTAVELQYIGNNQFMPVSSSGSLWSN